MKKIIYVTENKNKILYTQRIFDGHDIKVIQKKIEIDEIQSSSAEKIVKDKANKAYKIIKKPLIVSDSEWKIPALKGFPGPYMKYVNNWFSVNDFLNLMKSKQKRIIYLNHLICGIDKKGIKVFKRKIIGTFAKKPQGKGTPLDRLVIPEGEKYTIAKCHNLKLYSGKEEKSWKGLIKWVLGESRIKN